MIFIWAYTPDLAGGSAHGAHVREDFLNEELLENRKLHEAALCIRRYMYGRKKSWGRK